MTIRAKVWILVAASAALTAAVTLWVRIYAMRSELPRQLGIGPARKHQNASVGLLFANGLDDVEAMHPRQAEIADQQRGRLAQAILQALATVAELRRHFQARHLLHRDAQHLPHNGFVFDQNNRFGRHDWLVG